MSTLRSKVVRQLGEDMSVPSLTPVVDKLHSAIERGASMEEIDLIVRIEPGLTSKVIQLANSVAFRGKSIQSVEDALFRIGMQELRQMAIAIGVLDKVAHMKIKVNWNQFWLHSLLVARLSESITSCFRHITGREYLAGLLHDVGKLFLEHFFPMDFETSILRATERCCGMYEAEIAVFDITHSEIGAMLSEKWGLHKEITRSIRFHHDPESPFNKDPLNPDEERLLTHAIALADALANVCHANIQGAKHLESMNLEDFSEWQAFQRHIPICDLQLDLPDELAKAQAIIDSFF